MVVVVVTVRQQVADYSAHAVMVMVVGDAGLVAFHPPPAPQDVARRRPLSRLTDSKWAPRGSGNLLPLPVRSFAPECSLARRSDTSEVLRCPVWSSAWNEDSGRLGGRLIDLPNLEGSITSENAPGDVALSLARFSICIKYSEPLVE
jgi:hypothetical protein